MDDDLNLLVGLGVYDDASLDNQINGLGAMIKAPFTPQQKAGVKNLVKDTSKKALLASTGSHGSRFLLSQLDKLDKQTQEDIKTGKSRLVTRDYYFRRQVTPAISGSTDLLKSSDIIKVGTQNLDKNYLPAGENLVLTKIKFSSCYSASGTTVDMVTFTNALVSTFGGAGAAGGTAAIALSNDVATLQDKLIINGELNIYVDGGLVVSLPVRKFYRDMISMSDECEGGKDCVHLESPILIRENQRIEARLYYAAVGTALGNYTYVELRLMGVATAPRSS
jgi:hypothetical protein